MFNFLKQIIFPKFCLNCNFYGLYICKKCQYSLVLQDSICLFCEKESTAGSTHADCYDGSGIDGVISVFHYTTLLKKIIANIKYRLVTDAFTELFSCIEVSSNKLQFSSLPNPLYIQPIPLHKNKHKLRGFNQSELIARWVQEKTCGKIISALERVKETKVQAKLDKRQRAENARNAFVVKKGSDIKGRNILIVDDVVTTGSTVKEAARALKEAGAGQIWVFSITKG